MSWPRSRVLNLLAWEIGAPRLSVETTAPTTDARTTAPVEAARGEAAPVEARVRFEVVTTSGSAAAVECRIRADTVEIWHHRVRSGVFDRPTLTDWLTEPSGPLTAGELIFSLDTLVDVHGRVGLTLPDVTPWALSPAALAELQAKLSRPPTRRGGTLNPA